jgi:hypothetical protein
VIRALLAFALAAPAAAQIVSPLNPGGAGGVDAATVDSKIAVATAPLATAAQLASKADASAIPPVCSTPPSADTLNGTAGSGAQCTPRGDNTRPTAVQAGNTTLAADCTFTVTFARSFTSATPFVYAAVVDTAGNQMPCKTKTRSSAGFTGVCQGSQNTVLSLSIVTSGLTLLPFGTTCTAGTPVMFVGREPTQ